MFRTAESVTQGHPDKVCDIICDALVDEYLANDPGAHISVKAIAGKGIVTLAGELGSTDPNGVHVDRVVRKVIEDIGYTDPTLGFSAGSVEIIDRIDRHTYKKGANNPKEAITSMDQGFVFGYASNETAELMPLPILLANQLAERLDQQRRAHLSYLLPDGKVQLTLKGDLLDCVVISAMHQPEIAQTKLKEDLFTKVALPILKRYWSDQTRFLVNAYGRFVVGGPAVDAGLTGRKLMVDTYGDAARHGGGAFSGKDPRFTDRCGAYLARNIAVMLIKEGLTDACEVELAYVQGLEKPWDVRVLSNDKKKDEHLSIVARDMSLTISQTIIKMDLQRPIYRQTASYGHFGRDFPWEKYIER